MFNKYELDIIESLLNTEIKEYLLSGYGRNNEYVVSMRSILKKLDLKEYYDFDSEEWDDEDDN